jgi:hypothetical protein
MPERGSTSRWALLVAAICCALFAALSIPFLTSQREIAAGVPSPRALLAISLETIPAHERLCVSDVTIPPDARRLRFDIGTFGQPGPPLRLTLSGADYRERVVVAGGYADNLVMSPAMRPPARAVLGSVCIANAGATKIALTGTTEERSVSRPVGHIGGEVAASDVYLAFVEQRPASVLQRSHEIVARMSVFRPAVVGPTVLWALVVLVLVGIPIGVLAAVLSALRGRRRERPGPTTLRSP